MPQEKWLIERPARTGRHDASAPPLRALEHTAFQVHLLGPTTSQVAESANRSTIGQVRASVVRQCSIRPDWPEPWRIWFCLSLSGRVDTTRSAQIRCGICWQGDGTVLK